MLKVLHLQQLSLASQHIAVGDFEARVLRQPVWPQTCFIRYMSKPTQLQCTVVIHDTRNALAVQLEERIQKLREPEPNRRSESGLRSNLTDIVLGNCDCTYVVLRECWKLR